MALKYQSTRGLTGEVSFTEAVALGLAPDGGLFLPVDLPDIGARLGEWESLSYPELAFRFFQLFADDMEESVLRSIVERAYRSFSDPEIAPFVRLRDDLYVLELFHGPTLAFKDFALQVLGGLYEDQIRRTGRPITVLGATSGDTGAAAIHGLKGRQGVRIFILYPEGRVSPLQERQMACVGDPNVFALAVEGTFDDAQAVLKELFADRAFTDSQALSAVNSINLARILAQSIYYIHAWRKLPLAARQAVEFIVPTGNFGNVLAGWMAQKMGLPVQSLVVATNRNDILHRLFATGVYAAGAVHASHAPSMDIQVASNFERFLYYATGRDPARVREVMEELKSRQSYRFPHFDRDTFRSTSCTDDEIVVWIRKIRNQFQYLCDPHTACAFPAVLPPGSGRTQIVLATAHPAKFPNVIEQAVGSEPRAEALESLRALPIHKHRLPASAAAVRDFILAHPAAPH